MTPKALRMAGWFAMSSAVLSLPLIYLSLRFQGRLDLEARILQSLLQVFGTIIYVFVMTLLKRFLNNKFSFRETDDSIDRMIRINITIGFFAVVSLYVRSLEASIGIFIIVATVAYGVLEIIFGMKLLKLPDDLRGLLKPYCYVNIATGIFLSSIVMVLLGIVTGAVSDVMLGTIFFQAAKRVNAHM
ncbi:MAG: hypothetical protein FD174_865 [Geobacteraceae bacterium]|nr:MAG: hypothetical protein FD174_865 [Geobacteraceae bacterium]